MGVRLVGRLLAVTSLYFYNSSCISYGMGSLSLEVMFSFGFETNMNHRASSYFKDFIISFSPMVTTVDFSLGLGIGFMVKVTHFWL